MGYSGGRMDWVAEYLRLLKMIAVGAIAGAACSSIAIANPVMVDALYRDPFVIGPCYVIATILIEFPFVKIITGFKALKSLLATFIMNLVSALPGLIMPFIFVGSIKYTTKGFTVNAFFVLLFSLVILDIFDTFIEMIALKFFFKHKPKPRDYWILGLANVITLAIYYLVAFLQFAT